MAAFDEIGVVVEELVDDLAAVFLMLAMQPWPQMSAVEESYHLIEMEPAPRRLRSALLPSLVWLCSWLKFKSCGLCSSLCVVCGLWAFVGESWRVALTPSLTLMRDIDTYRLSLSDQRYLLILDTVF